MNVPQGRWVVQPDMDTESKEAKRGRTVRRTALLGAALVCFCGLTVVLGALGCGGEPGDLQAQRELSAAAARTLAQRNSRFQASFDGALKFNYSGRQSFETGQAQGTAQFQRFEALPGLRAPIYVDGTRAYTGTPRRDLWVPLAGDPLLHLTVAPASIGLLERAIAAAKRVETRTVQARTVTQFDGTFDLGAIEEQASAEPGNGTGGQAGLIAGQTISDAFFRVLVDDGLIREYVIAFVSDGHPILRAAFVFSAFGLPTRFGPPKPNQIVAPGGQAG